MATIVVEGPIGVGKTSLSRYLASELGARVLLEVVEENPFLAGFYREPERFAFQTQVFFLLSRIAKRGRSFEHAIDPDYLARIGEAYDELFRHAPYRVHVVEAGDVDYVASEADRRALFGHLITLARAA